MPRSRTAAAKSEAEQVYMCVEAYTDGRTLVPVGTRLRGDHEQVRLHRPYFVEDASDEAGRLSAVVSLHGHAAPAPAEPEPVPKMMCATRPVSAVVSLANTGISQGFAPTTTALVELAEGDVVAADNTVVAQFPDAFEPID